MKTIEVLSIILIYYSSCIFTKVLVLSFGMTGDARKPITLYNYTSIIRQTPESAQKSKKNAKSKVDSMTGKRENLGTKLPSECSIQGKELGSLLSHYRIKNIRI